MSEPRRDHDMTAVTRTLAIGDVHGCLRALTDLVDYADVGPGDTLVMLGDYVDRGPATAGVIEYLIGFSRAESLITLRGNHEVMMLAAMESPLSAFTRSWLGVGGAEALDSYGTADWTPLVDQFSLVPESHWAFLESTMPWFETDSHIFVHGTVKPGLPMEEQPESTLYWDRFGDYDPHRSGKTVICGHTSQKSGRPAVRKRAICIDTNAYGGGWLSCLDVESGTVWQTSESGKRRTFTLDDLTSGRVE